MAVSGCSLQGLMRLHSKAWLLGNVLFFFRKQTAEWGGSKYLVNVVFFGVPWGTAVMLKNIRCIYCPIFCCYLVFGRTATSIGSRFLNCVAPQRKSQKECACCCAWSHLKHTLPGKFEPVQRTEMTSSLPHPALLEDLSKTCGSTLPLHCTLIGSWTPMFFLLLERTCVFAHKQVSFYYLGLACLSLGFDFICPSFGLLEHAVLGWVRDRGPLNWTEL